MIRIFIIILLPCMWHIGYAIIPTAREPYIKKDNIIFTATEYDVTKEIWRIDLEKDHPERK